LSENLEDSIVDYRLHLLDVVPTVKQIGYEKAAKKKAPVANQLSGQHTLNNYYAHAGLGKLTRQQIALYYRASPFGNSSHRHGDQGNIALFDRGIGILVPTGSFGYRFGSKHHSDWTRQTIAHNLPLVDGQGQILDDQSSVGRVLQNTTESDYHVITLDLSDSYDQPLERFHRTLILFNDDGLIVVDSILLQSANALNWRLHSALNAELDTKSNNVLLSEPTNIIDRYKCHLLSHPNVRATLDHGYSDELQLPGSAIESDAGTDVVHIDWQLEKSREHTVIASCIAAGRTLPEVQILGDAQEDSAVIELKFQQRVVTIPVVP